MKCLVVYAPHAMKSKVTQYKKYISYRLREKFEVVDFAESKYRTHTSEIAEKACGNYDVIIALGGDGTLNEIINGIAEKKDKPIIGFLPCGTVNDFARSLKIPRKLDKAIEVILSGKTFQHDIFKIGNRYGIYVLAAGILSSCSYITGQEYKRRYGWYAYAYEAMKELFRKNRMTMKIVCDNDKIFEGNFAFALFANSNSVAGIPVNQNAELNDGLIDVVLLRQFRIIALTNLISILRLIKLFLFKIKTIKNTKYFVHVKAKEVEIHNYTTAKLNLDGEYGGKPERVYLKMLQKEVEIYTPDTNESVKPYLMQK